MTKKLPIAKPFIGEEEIEAVSEVLRSGWVTQGPKVREFEQAFASMVGARHACAVSNCTTALHLALLSAGVSPGDIVITVSHSYIATANAVRYCGAEPAFIDIEPETFNISLQALQDFFSNECELRDGQFFFRRALSLRKRDSPLVNVDPKQIGRIAAVLAVHQIGIPCRIREIVRLAGEYGLPVVEDAACAVGSRISPDRGQTWEPIGRPHGDVACFSFHPRKVLTTGEGGMLTTNSDEKSRFFRLARQHGMSVPDLARHESRQVAIEAYHSMGFNYRLTDIQAAIGLKQLARLEDMLEHRRKLARCYRELFAQVPWIRLPALPDDVMTNWQSFAVLLDEGAPAGRKALMQSLLDQGIATRPAVMNAHQERPYSNGVWDLPKSEQVRARGILLPMFEGMEESDCEWVVQAIIKS